MQNIMDMDTRKISYVSESSNTSGYSTMSPGPGGVSANLGNLSPASSVYSMSSSPAQSPATAALQNDFSNLNLPRNSTHLPQQQQQYTTLQNTSMVYLANNAPLKFSGGASGGHIANVPSTGAGIGIVNQFCQPQFSLQSSSIGSGGVQQMKLEYQAGLRIIEYPVEKFRFRYKSEMHGTHGSLNGANSKRTPKTFPEVELVNFNGHAVIRCSLFQTNIDSPHSHQLVVRKDDVDICDPHDLHVSSERGYVAQFQNMGIIHTAKKFIFEELLKKKTNRLRFELGRDELSTKQMQELHKETEKEAKDMNLNQVRLCFEAFKVEDNSTWTRIAAPVFTNPINNRKSAQTGELRICRLSIATGSVSGDDDLILLVEKVSKKNIKVRFYELNEDEEVVWEDFGKFRESDVHHQYAIICQTPAYKNKDIDKPVEVCIELVRPSDDERSYPPVTFRYKPRDAIISRKRRRTNSSATSSSGSSGSMSSFELPKTVEEQATLTQVTNTMQPLPGYADVQASHGIRISEEFNRDNELRKLMDNGCFRENINVNSEELLKYCQNILSDDIPYNSGNMNVDFTQASYGKSGRLESDSVSTTSFSAPSNITTEQQRLLLRKALQTPTTTNKYPQIQYIFKIYENTRNIKNVDESMRNAAAKQISDIYTDFANKNDDSLMHEIIFNQNLKGAIKICEIFNYFKINQLINLANSKGHTALHCACLYDHALYIRPLLNLGCDPNLQDCKGNTVLHIAVQEHQQDCIEILLNRDVGEPSNLDIRNDEGLTALHLAIRMNKYNVAEKLLKYNRVSALTCNTKDGNNALHMAVLQQDIKLIKLILEGQHITDIISMRNTARQTAFDLAKNMGTKNSLEILDFLKTYCANDDIKIAIKEEDVSASSTDDEEDNETSSMGESSLSTAGSLTTNSFEKIDIKEEQNEVDECNEQAMPIPADTAKNESTENLEKILNDKQKFKELVMLLDKENKWKKLAKMSQMQHLSCLWNNAEDMLCYVKKKASSIEYRVFAKALLEVDEDALHVLQRTI